MRQAAGGSPSSRLKARLNKSGDFALHEPAEALAGDVDRREAQCRRPPRHQHAPISLGEQEQVPRMKLQSRCESICVEPDDSFCPLLKFAAPDRASLARMFR